ncbi:MAG: peptidoglycan-binding protein [Clostridiales bacterium]|nr:peptidoglycan-binding protein [Clostridiales bacterium]
MMRRLSAAIAACFFALCLPRPAVRAETILWEDESGSVILGDGGEVTFLSPDGEVTDLFLLDATPTPVPEEPSLLTEEEAGPPPGETVAGETVPEETAPEESAFRFRRTLRYGDNDDSVRRLQTRLAELGFYEARVSGGYYKVTQSAVRAFQRQNGLTSDGVAGRTTQEALFSASAVPASATPKPTATPTPAKYTLMVDVTNQIVRCYTYDEEGDYSVLVREMICSTGTKKNPTPLGTTIMPKTRARWGYFPTWDSHAQYLTRIDRANAFHSVLYTEPDELSLVVSSFEALGTRQSHGCVRLLVSDARWIYENCEAGTIITVYESGLYDPEYTMTLKPRLNQETMRERSLPAPTPTPVYRRENWPVKFRTLSRGKTGEDVFFLQMRLRELGYYDGTVTGGYYGGTIEAVTAFQNDHGLKVDGVAGKQTQKLLFSPESDPTPSPAPTPTPTADPLLLTPRPDFVG